MLEEGEDAMSFGQEPPQNIFIRQAEIGYDTPPGESGYDSSPAESDGSTPAVDPQWLQRRRVLAGLAGAAVLLGVGPTVVRMFRRIHAPVRGPEGTKLWSFHMPGTVAGGLVAVGNVVYTADSNSNGGPSSHNVYAFDALTGRELWVYGGFGPTVVANGVLFTGMGIDCSVRAITAETGLSLWTYATGGIIKSLTVAGGVVYAGSDDGYLYAINAATGAGIWSYPTGGAVRSGIAVANGAVYFASDDHYVYAAHAATGKPKWSYRTRGPVQSGVAAAGRAVVAGSTDGTVYGLLA